jgi:hypothetical protein
MEHTESIFDVKKHLVLLFEFIPSLLSTYMYRLVNYKNCFDWTSLSEIQE